VGPNYLVILSLSLFLSGWLLELGPRNRSVVPTSCEKVDEYGSPSFQNEMLRLDEYAKRVKNESGAVAIVVIHPTGRQSVQKAQARASRIMGYLVNRRGVNPDHIAAVTMDERRPEGETQLFICPFFPPNNLRQMYKGKVIVGTDIVKQAR